MPGSPARRYHNLPAHRVRLIGREHDLQVARQALLGSQGRLLTLTGTGGCGKTRLALELASSVVADFPDGVWLIELAAVADQALVPATIVAALGVRERLGARRRLRVRQPSGGLAAGCVPVRRLPVRRAA